MQLDAGVLGAASFIGHYVTAHTDTTTQSGYVYSVEFTRTGVFLHTDPSDRHQGIYLGGNLRSLEVRELRKEIKR